MCGIFGFAGFEDAGLLHRMGKRLEHRGPDGEGYFESPRFSMGMRRLSIIDLEGGAQPIYDEEGLRAVCFNGEIYNYVELRDELVRKGHDFRTVSDTEVIVHAFEEWGIDCLERLNGMFAFALWDGTRDELWLARDRAGQKPLYYHWRNGRLLFASEVKALLEAPDVERRANPAAIEPYLTLRYVPGPETLFAGVRTLPAGHWMRLRGSDLEIRRYWDVPLHEGPFASEAELKEELEETFFDAVRLTLRSDVPLGAYLSAGVDSSLTLAAMVAGGFRTHTFSIGFRSPIDETPDARRLAERLGCTHHEVHAEPEDFELLPRVLWHLERPIGDALILAYYLLARETSRRVKVVLSGEGADESFAGYSFHKIILWTQRLNRMFPAFLTQRAAGAVVDALPVGVLDKLFVYPAYLGREGRRKTADYLRHYGSRNLNQSYVTLKALFDRGERRELYADAWKDQASEAWIAPPRDTGGPFLDRLLKLQFDDWLQDNLLLRQDKNTMAHSLELRCPFLDHRVIELAFRMPGRMKVRGFADKWVERELGRKLLPPENVRRSKNPFYFPLEYFHENPKVRELIALTLDPERVRRRGYFAPEVVQRLVTELEGGEFLRLKQVMSLVILELWHMVFIDGEQP